jgi:solute carrier family 25 phosphate transporter 3
MRLPILFISSGIAEVIASWALCPLEVTRIFMVTTPNFKGSLGNAMAYIISAEGIGGLFKGINWILLRQVPYTCVKLAGYDIISSRMKKIAQNQKSDNNCADRDTSASTLTFIQLCSGVIAGVLAATISQPADVLLSKLCGSGTAIISDSCVL